VDHELHAASLVEEALEDHVALGREDTECGPGGGQVTHHLGRHPDVDARLGCEPSRGGPDVTGRQPLVEGLAEG
jgi:hypothetical protein